MHATLSTTKRKRKARNGVCTSGLLANPVFFFKSHCGVFLKKRGEREDEKVKRAQSNRGRCLPSEVAQEGENMRWIVDILIGDDFVKLWAEPHEISKITAQLCIAIGRGHILVPKDSRFSLLSTWMEAHSAWMTRSCRSVDKKLVKDGQFSPFYCLNNRSLWIRRLCNMKQWTSTEKDVWDHSICRAEIDSPIQPLGIGLAETKKRSSNQRRTIYSAEGCCMRGHNQLILAQGNSEAPCHYSAAEEHIGQGALQRDDPRLDIVHSLEEILYLESPQPNMHHEFGMKQHIAARFQRLLESNGSFELHLPLRLQSPRYPILSEGLWIFQTSLLLHKPLTELSILPASIRMKLRNTDAKDFMISLFFDR
ncbi:hypothetical protein SADUNF_Sadunf15G0040200 [Salix dunnii]|uniref:At3g05675-like ankyrin-like domain-containing protein n=1 Tax=Salix dunnii TaxID=1413687 RepID=A0A835MIC6_9ROSI|nr:hypothetical protein SADUNF_Sadunf15G0040200 [Salix dunnii]